MSGFSKPVLALLLLLLLGLVSVLQVAMAQEEGAETTRVLNTLLDEFLAGASVNDRATHEAFWADELIYTSSSGQRFGKATILSGLDASTPDQAPVPRYSASEVQVRDFGELAVVTFRLLAHQDGELIDQYFNTGVFRHADDGWRAVTWHATRIPSEAAED